MSAPSSLHQPSRARNVLAAVCLSLLGGVAAAEGSIERGATEGRPFQDLADRRCVLHCSAADRAGETSEAADAEAATTWVLSKVEMAGQATRPGAAPPARTDSGLSRNGSLAIVGLGLVLTVVGAWRALVGRTPPRQRHF